MTESGSWNPLLSKFWCGKFDQILSQCLSRCSFWNPTHKSHPANLLVRCHLKWHTLLIASHYLKNLNQVLKFQSNNEKSELNIFKAYDLFGNKFGNSSFRECAALFPYDVRHWNLACFFIRKPAPKIDNFNDPSHNLEAHDYQCSAQEFSKYYKTL